MDRVLVVGATGILAPAAAALAASGAAVSGLARSGDGMPSGVEPLLVDGRDAVAVRAVLGHRRWDAAIVYCPAVSKETVPVFRRAADRVVEVRTSSAADPSHGEVLLHPDVLLLGWSETDAGARWHTPGEVSEAALAVLADGAGRMLGAVRPWAERP